MLCPVCHREGEPCCTVRPTPQGHIVGSRNRRAGMKRPTLESFRDIGYARSYLRGWDAADREIRRVAWDALKNGRVK